jgi:hypothetical protein
MPPPLKQSRAVRDLAETLYDFLPGSGHGSWKGHVTFKSVAEKAGVGTFWPGGSKNPALCSLLERTLEFRRSSFEPLVVEIVRCGLTYRQKQGHPVTPEEPDRINGLIVEVGFKFPDLWDPDFRASLCADGPKRAQERVEEARAAERLRETERSRRSVELEKLKDEFLGLCRSSDRQAAGRKLEGLLNRLFALYDLAPREPFRVITSATLWLGRAWASASAASWCAATAGRRTRPKPQVRHRSCWFRTAGPRATGLALLCGSRSSWRRPTDPHVVVNSGSDR